MSARRTMEWRNGLLERAGIDLVTGERKPEIEVELVAPPIPIRTFDWRAWRHGQEEGLQGWGETSVEAISDLLRREKDQNGRRS